MTVTELENLKTKITEMQNRKSKAEGAIEQILNGWKSYGFKTVNEAEDYVKKLKEIITENQNKVDKLWGEIQTILGGVKE